MRLYLGILTILFSTALIADELTIPYVVNNACPFEGCTFGNWDVLKEAKIFSQPNSNSNVVGKLHINTKVDIETGILFVIPGEAKVNDKKYGNPEDVIYILDYIGSGRSRIFLNGKFDIVKIARTKNRCTDNPNRRYCWVDVLKEPVTKWWVKVRNIGWVSMDGKPLKPIDNLS